MGVRGGGRPGRPARRNSPIHSVNITDCNIPVVEAPCWTTAIQYCTGRVGRAALHDTLTHGTSCWAGAVSQQLPSARGVTQQVLHHLIFAAPAGKVKR